MFRKRIRTEVPLTDRALRNWPFWAVAWVATLILVTVNAAAQEIKAILSERADNLGVNAVVFSFDGQWLFSVGSEGLKQWNTKTFTLTHQPSIEIGEPGSATANSIQCVVSSRTGPEIYLAAGSNDVIVWNYEKQVEIGRIPSNGFWRSALSVCDDGKLLAIAENQPKVDVDGHGEFRVHLWDLVSGKSRMFLTGHVQAINSVDFSPDGKYVIGRAHAGAIIWSTDEGNVVRRIGQFGQAEFGNSLLGERKNVAFSPDGTKILFGNALISTSDGREILTIKHGANVVAFASDGNQILLGGVGSVGLFDARNGALVASFKQFPITGYPIQCMATSADGTLLATGGSGRHRNLADFGKENEIHRNLCVWQLPQGNSR